MILFRAQRLHGLNGGSAAGSLLSLGYGYNSGSNNGNVASATIARPSLSLSQSFTYDAANRLLTASETGGSGDWSQTYGYDAFGNRAVTAGYIPNSCCTPTAVAQFTNNQWLGTGVSYDAAGNQKALPSSSFSYDAENRVITATEPNTGAISYVYDGEGKRVQKTVGTSLTTYVYDAFGSLAAEYATQSNTNGLLYLTADALGSTRLATNSTGAAQECYDYFPFGEDIQQSIGGRGSCYPTGVYPGNPDIESMKFTGKERDAETGMDFFLARYYSSSQGRFTSPDEFKGGFLDAFTGQAEFQPGPLPYADLSDPQTLNKYTYVRNNPLQYTDPNGHCVWDLCIGEGAAVYAAGAATVTAAAYLMTPQGKESARAAIEGTGLLINRAADAISSLFTKSDSKPGTLGKPDHQQTVKEEGERVNGQTEVPIPTPGGAKEGRRAEAVGTNPQTGTPEIVQVYRPTPAGNIPKREQTAAADIENATGVKPTMVPVRPLTPPKPDPENQ